MIVDLYHLRMGIVLLLILILSNLLLLLSLVEHVGKIYYRHLLNPKIQLTIKLILIIRVLEKHLRISIFIG